MRTYRWNGEYWYVDHRSFFKRLRQWFVWFGGWETAIDGWMFFLFDFDKRWWNPKGLYLKRPFPLSLFGHLITFYSWGFDVKLRSGFLVVTLNKRDEGPQIYISKDGTPSEAHHWIMGAPNKVILEAFKGVITLKEVEYAEER